MLDKCAVTAAWSRCATLKSIYAATERLGELDEGLLGLPAICARGARATPVFNGPRKGHRRHADQAGLSETGQVTLHDGRTGEAFSGR